MEKRRQKDDDEDEFGGSLEKHQNTPIFLRSKRE
jgi:hypothetical protein